MMCLLLMILRNVDLWCDLHLKRRKIVHEPPHKYKEVLKKNMENINNCGKRKLKCL